MAIYTQYNHSTIETLTHIFGVGDIIKFSALEGGSENTNYYVETKLGKYVLTICEKKSFRDSSNLADLLCYLEQQSIHTSKVIASKEGAKVILYDDKPITLKKYIEGEVIKDLSDPVMVQLGEIISDLHKVPAPTYLSKSFPYGRKYFSELNKEDIKHSFIQWLSVKEAYLQENIPKDLPKSLIHGDIFYDNIIIKENKLIALMDFEEACSYYRMFDLGMAIVGTCQYDNNICFEKAKHLISGYNKNQKLLSTEKETLQTFTIYAAVATAFWRFRQYHVVHKDKLLHHKHLEMQNLADKILEYPALRFMELFS